MNTDGRTSRSQIVPKRRTSDGADYADCRPDEVVSPDTERITAKNAKRRLRIEQKSEGRLPKTDEIQVSIVIREFGLSAFPPRPEGAGDVPRRGGSEDRTKSDVRMQKLGVRSRIRALGTGNW